MAVTGGKHLYPRVPFARWMRVLHVVKKFPPLVGGDATAVDALARAQRRQGIEVDVATYNADGIDDRAARRVGPPQEGADLDRITFRRLRGMAAFRRWARDGFEGLRPSVVHAHAVDVGYAIAPIAEDRGVPTMLTCHGVWFPTTGRWSLRGRLEISLIRKGRYRAVTAVDAASVAALKSIGVDARVVPNGVDLEEFAGPRARDGPFRFLFAGRHERQKGLDVLLAAVVDLRRGGRPFLVDIVGDGVLTDDLRRRATASGLDRVVRFPGRLPRDALVRAFLAADAFVLPSRYEGFPLAILEAWAARLPVIATSVGGIPDVCTSETARLVPPNDPKELARAMADVLTDENLRAGLSFRGHALARERFSWDAVARAYGDVYATITG